MVTEVTIEKLTPRTKQQFLWDDDLKGFGVCCYPSGRKTFVVRTSVNRGRRVLITIGAIPDVNLLDARHRARELLRMARNGVNPREKGLTTVGQLVEDYLNLHAKKRKKSWKKDEGYLADVIRAWDAAKPLSTVVRRDVSAVFLAKSRNSPYAANRMLEVVKKMFNLAIQWELYAGVNPATGIPKNPEKKRTRFLTLDEARAVFAGLRAETAVVQAIFWTLLLTGARKKEVLTAKWSALDWISRTLTFPDTKNGDPHVVPLRPEAVSMLEALPRESEYLFPGKCGQRARVNIDKVWQRVKDRAVRAGAAVGDVRIHDIRRTTGSWLAQEGKELLVIAKLLNQRDIRSTLVYARLNIDPVRRAIEGNERLKLLGAPLGERAS